MKIVFIVLAILIYKGGLAQDPDIFQTWYLTDYIQDLGGEFDVSDVDPPIVPSLTISTTLDFTGVGACNTFSGTFTYDSVHDLFYTQTFSSTNRACEYQSHTDFEVNYFSYFDGPGYEVFYAIENGSSGEQLLYMDIGNSILNLSNVQLSNPSFDLDRILVYPNPTSEVLFISSEGAAVQTIAIYDPLGQLIREQTGEVTQVDVSALPQGVYFMEINFDDGKTVQKFIKK